MSQTLRDWLPKEALDNPSPQLERLLDKEISADPMSTSDDPMVHRAFTWLCSEFDALSAKVAELAKPKRDPDEDKDGRFRECDACRAKSGSPLLCGDCLRRRSEWSKREDVAPLQVGKVVNDDRLLKIAALFNGWANAGPGDGGPRNGWTAQKVLNQIGEVLGDPFTREPNVKPAKEEEFRAGLPAEALTILHDLYQVLWCEAFYDPTNEETQKFAWPISVKMTRLNELLRFKS